MTPDISTHLTNEELDDVLIGLGSLKSEAHLARCLECRSRVESFRADILLFNSASMAWSESRAGRSASAHHPVFRIRLAFLSWSAVAALLVITGLVLWLHTTVAPSNRSNITESQAVDSEAQIEKDNELLQEINAAISSDDVSPIEEYNLRERPQAR
jgi:hypothetical protein